MGFGQPFAGKTHVELFSQLQSYFIGEYAKGKRVVLIIDEAQNLSVDMLEELRMLSNINAGKDQLLQLILVGQPQLKGILNRPEMLQLAQRVGSDFHLMPLSREEVDAYIDTRLRIAGARRRVFTERAVDLVAEQSSGVPRVINIIADTALVYAFSAQDQTVDVDTIRSVIRDKTDYGVFGLARADLPPQRRPEPEGPAAFVQQPAPVRRAVRPVETEEAPRQERVEDAPLRLEDAPRMPAARRPRARLVVQEEPAPAPNLYEVARTAPAARLVAAPELEVESRLREPEPEPYTPPAIEEPPVEEPVRSEAFAVHVGVVVIGAGASPDQTIRSVSDAGPIVFVAQPTDEHAVAAARSAGADIVAIGEQSLSPGRARNAGYRQLKKARPGLSYVQFVEAGFVLDPDWLDVAVDFMERRPEVAAIEGAVSERFAKKSAYNLAAARAAEGEPGEIQSTASNALVRAEAFEAAGGFRGDLPVNETQDLCVRLRRRGAHIWRVDAPMGARDSGLSRFSDWWMNAQRNGYQYAHGAALHGSPPERLFAREQARAMLWGAILPALILLAAFGGGAAIKYFAPLANPWAIVAAALVLGALAYLVRIVYVAFLVGAGKKGSLAYGFLTTLGHVPEFFGAWRYYSGGARAKKARRAAN
jgi:hypothetical protein